MFTLLLGAGAPSPGVAQVIDTHRVLLDVDADVTTGCDVPVMDAEIATVVGGIEQMLLVQIEHQAGQATVTALLRYVCDGTSFTTVELLPGGWPVGADTGIDGADVIELAIARAALGDPAVVRLVVSSTTNNGGDADVLLSVDGSPDGAALRHALAVLGRPAPAPAVSPLALSLVVATLAAVAWRALRKDGRAGVWLIVLVALAAFGAAWAATITPDGTPDDWAGKAPLGIDAMGDSSGGGTAIDIVAVFVTSDATHLFVRIDVKDAVKPPPTFTATATTAPIATQTPTATATRTPTATATSIATATTMATHTATRADTATSTPTATATMTGTATATDTPIATETHTPTAAPSATSTSTGTATTTPAGTAAATPSATATNTAAATETPIAAETHTPTATATATPADTATAAPADTATAAPVETATATSTDTPTATATGTSTPDGLRANPTAVVMTEGDAEAIAITGHSPSGDPLTFAIVAGPFHGGLLAGSNPVITQTGPTSAMVHYAPLHVDFTGADSFRFTVNDGVATSPSAMVSITVLNTQDDPTANDDAFTVAGDSSAQALDVLANDDDAPDPDETLTISAVGTPNMAGTAVLGGGGDVVIYAPPASFTGTETFTYTISDGNGGSASATVTVTVRPYDLECSEEVCDGDDCTRQPANEGVECDDDQNCTENDACRSGFCTGVSPCAHLEDLPCSRWSCDPQTLDGECVTVPFEDRRQCPHPDPCVRISECIDGLCIDRDRYPECE